MIFSKPWSSRNHISWFEVQKWSFGFIDFENWSKTNQNNGGNNRAWLDPVHQDIVSTFQKLSSKVSNVKSQTSIRKSKLFRTKIDNFLISAPTNGGVSFCRSSVVGDKILMTIRPVCSRLRRPQAAAFGGITWITSMQIKLETHPVSNILQK